MAFTTAQQTQWNRIPTERQATLDATKAERYTAVQLRARANVLSVKGGVVTYSPQNNYTATERQTIADDLASGDKWLIRIPEIVAGGLSIKQRLAALEGRL
jgi:hypothetical protein